MTEEEREFEEWKRNQPEQFVQGIVSLILIGIAILAVVCVCVAFPPILFVGLAVWFFSSLGDKKT